MPAANGRALTTKGRTALTKQGIMERGLGRRALMLVVLAAVVALGAFLVVRPAEAADIPLAADTNSVSAAPGDTVQIAVLGALAQVSITGTGDGVSASFAANDGQSISCADNTSCDENDTANEIQIDLNVADDSAEGYILLSVAGVAGTTPTAQVTKVITVSKATQLGSLDVATSSKTIAANDDNTTADDGGPNEADILATVKNASSPAGGLNGQQVTFITTLGTLACPGSSDANGANTIAAVSGVQVCSVWTTNQDNPLTADTDAADGFATVRLDGAKREGVATVTVTTGGLTEQLEVTMYGTAKNLTAEPQQGSIEIGGEVYVVLTVTDDAGNPVAGQVVAPVTSPDKEVEGPTDDAVLVVATKDTPAADSTTDSVGVGYSKDFIHATDASQNLPACGNDAVGDLAGPSTEVFATDGTNADGKCVVHVTAPDEDGTDDDATRGAHTLNFAIGTIKASATIDVAGSPNSITTDAPASVDPASVTKITVSVWDDTNVLVGITEVKVRKVDGGGLIEDQGDGGSEMTVDGQSAFTFIAPSGAGTAEILITAGDVSQRVMLTIGEPEDTGPTVIELTDGPASTYVAWSDDWGTVSSSTFENVAGLVVVWKWTGTMWIGYTSSPTAPAATKTNFTVGPADVLYVIANGAVTITIY